MWDDVNDHRCKSYDGYQFNDLFSNTHSAASATPYNEISLGDDTHHNGVGIDWVSRDENNSADPLRAKKEIVLCKMRLKQKPKKRKRYRIGDKRQQLSYQIVIS